MRVLINFHTKVNAGYAMQTLEKTFFEVFHSITENSDDIYFAFNEYSGEHVNSLPDGFLNVMELNRAKLDNNDYFMEVNKTLLFLQFDLAFCFDLQVSSPLVSVLRKSRIKTVVSYWGSTMSSLNTSLMLMVKKLEVALSKNKPDLFIFESESMRDYAINGRGISKKLTTVIPTGVDIDVFRPVVGLKKSLAKIFPLTEGKLICVYSGHMEERKGVTVLINAIKNISEKCDTNSWHLLICGNRPGEKERFINMLDEHPAQNDVTFAGYRDDLPFIMSNSDVGVIASTGWDSFPMSALEMAACGLPIIVSNLQGLSETVEHNVTGILFEPGNDTQLSEVLMNLEGNKSKLNQMSVNARQRIVSRYSLGIQKNALKNAIIKLL